MDDDEVLQGLAMAVLAVTAVTYVVGIPIYIGWRVLTGKPVIDWESVKIGY